jgi:hypothetical protein
VTSFRFLLIGCFGTALLQPHPVLAQDARPYEEVSFYFAAHQDDWQLFMNPNAFLDVTNAKTKTVFVHMTAGDAGSGVGTRGRRHPFYLARDNGAEAAIRFMADADRLPVKEIATQMRFNGHPIYRVAYRNTVTYFLRVPDGNPDGTGYPETGNQSLQRLEEGRINVLKAIDGTTAYHGWADLVSTLRALIDYERDSAPAVQLNVGELNQRINPGDHSDHRMTARAALDAVKGLTCVRKLHYIDYASSRLPENLNSQQRDMESSVFAVTAAGVRAFDHSANWDWYDQSYIGKNYFRVEAETGRCERATPVLSTARR